MGTPGRQKINRYGVEFKLRAVQLSNQPGVLIKDVAESLCIPPFMLSKWRKQVRDGELVGKPPLLEQPAAAELRRLREVEKQFKYVAASFTAERIEQDIEAPDSHVLVAEARDTIVGYAHLVDGPVPFDADATGTRVVRLYVESKLIGSGIGAALMRAIIGRARDPSNEWLWLRVWEHNQQAIAFYRRWGFIRRSLVTFEMLGGMKTDWLMSLSIQSDENSAG